MTWAGGCGLIPLGDQAQQQPIPTSGLPALGTWPSPLPPPRRPRSGAKDSPSHPARRPAMGLASPVPDRCAAVNAAARRGVSRAALRTDAHTHCHVHPARRDAPRRHDLHRLASAAGVDAHSVRRPGRPARRVQQRAPATARIRQSRFTLVVPRRIPGRTPRSRYLGTSLNEQLGLEIRPGRGAALCDLADELPAAVLASLLGISVDTAGRWGALVKRDWDSYIAERDGQPLGPEQTKQIRAVGHPCTMWWSARITPSRVLRLPPPHRALSRAGVVGISVASSVVIFDEGQLLR